MISQVFRTISATATRTSFRRGPVLGKRFASTAHPEKAEKMFDPLWAAGSATLFGTLGYMVLTSDGKKHEESSHGHSTNTRKDTDLEAKRTGHEAGFASSSDPTANMADPTGKSALAQAMTSDAPGIAKAAEDKSSGESGASDSDEKSSIAQAMKSDEPKTAYGVEKGSKSGASGSEVQSSIKQAMGVDEPKTAYAAESKK